MALSAKESADYEFVIALVYERSRIRLTDGKHALISARLGKRMRQHGFDSFHDYVQFLRLEADEAEMTHVVDAVATNFTSFLREPDHFDFLVREALPGLLAKGRKRFQVWSAACATGEEPYSMAFYLAEHFPLAEGWDWQILATDVSTKALARARDAIYPGERLTGIPQEWLRRYFQRGHGEWAGQFRIKPDLRQRVRFQKVNLLDPLRMETPFEAIFCRNVMIYFDRETQESLVRQLTGFLVGDGFLLTGHSESLNGLATGLRCLRPSVYQRTKD